MTVINATITTTINTQKHTIFNLTNLGYELSSDDESLTAVDRSLRAQLGHHELEDVVGVSAHHQTDLLVIHP